MSEEESRFEEFLGLAGLLGDPSGSDMPEEVASQIRAGLRRRFDAPPLVTLEATLGAGAWSSVHGARKLLYFPDEEDMRAYPRLLALPPYPHEASQDHPQVGIAWPMNERRL